MKSHRLSQIAGAVVIALGLSTSAMAADTTSAGIRGNVVSPAGEFVTGAEITVFDNRTGSVRTFNSNESGSLVLAVCK